MKLAYASDSETNNVICTDSNSITHIITGNPVFQGLAHLYFKGKIVLAVLKATSIGIQVEN